MENERSAVILSMLEKFKEDRGRDAMRILHISKGRIERSIAGFYDKVCQLHYGDEWNSPSGKKKLYRYLSASAEYLRSLEAADAAKKFLESVDEEIFGIDR